MELLAPEIFRVTLVGQNDVYACIQERLLAQARLQRLNS